MTFICTIVKKKYLYSIEFNRVIANPNPATWNTWTEFMSQKFSISFLGGDNNGFYGEYAYGNTPNKLINPGESNDIGYNDALTGTIYLCPFEMDTSYEFKNYSGNTHKIFFNGALYYIAPGAVINLNESRPIRMKFSDSINIDGSNIQVDRSTTEYKMFTSTSSNSIYATVLQNNNPTAISKLNITKDVYIPTITSKDDDKIDTIIEIH